MTLRIKGWKRRTLQADFHRKTDMFPEKLLLAYGAEYKEVPKGDYIFEEGDAAKHFYQLVAGKVKMTNLLEDGKEFIQGVFEPPQSFGEPPLFGDFPCPSGAVALEASKLLRLPKERFMQLLLDNPQEHLRFTANMAQRLRYKAAMQSEVAASPESRLLRLIDFLKQQQQAEGPYVVPLTRQQMGDMTGLRVETVIRTIKRMAEKGLVKLEQHKVVR